MKSTRFETFTVGVFLTLVLVATTTSASAQVLGITFVNSSTGTLYTGTGVLGESFTPFYGTTGSLAIGPTEVGTSGIDLSIAYPGPESYPGSDEYQYTNAATPAGIALYNNFIDMNYGTGSGLSFQLSDLTPNARYNVSLYSSVNGHYANQTPATWTVQGMTVGTTTSSSGSTNGDTFVLGLDYLVDYGVQANALGDINLSVRTTAPGAPAYLLINGIGLQEAPEPSTWAMMLGGLGALLFVSRRKLRA